VTDLSHVKGVAFNFPKRYTIKQMNCKIHTFSNVSVQYLLPIFYFLLPQKPPSWGVKEFCLAKKKRPDLSGLPFLYYLVIPQLKIDH